MFKSNIFPINCWYQPKSTRVGDEVCYVFGTGLDKGVIESITPFEFGQVD
jgi:hypothetical protein